MATHNELGKEGEDAAAFFLTSHEYTLHSRNWQFNHHEIDIVAECCGLYIFVEVKTRSSYEHGDGLEAVDRQKQEFLAKAANCYLNYFHLYDVPIRFDIITVIGKEKPFVITHYKGAFDPQQSNWENNPEDEFKLPL